MFGYESNVPLKHRLPIHKSGLFQVIRFSTKGFHLINRFLLLFRNEVLRFPKTTLVNFPGRFLRFVVGDGSYEVRGN